MRVTVLALLWGTGLVATYWSLYRTEKQVEIPLTLGLAAWSILALATGSVQSWSQGTEIVTSELLAQIFCLFVAVVHGFALVGAIFDYYPTDSMREGQTEEIDDVRQLLER